MADVTGSGPLLGEDRPRTCVECGAPLDPDVAHVQHEVACHALRGNGWPATARYFGPSRHAQWCRQEHDGPCLDVLLYDLFGDGCDCPEVCASCCVDPGCPLARQIPGQLTLDEAT